MTNPIFQPTTDTHTANVLSYSSDSQTVFWTTFGHGGPVTTTVATGVHAALAQRAMDYLREVSALGRRVNSHDARLALAQVEKVTS